MIHTGGADPRYVSNRAPCVCLINTLFAMPFDAERTRGAWWAGASCAGVRRAVGADIGIAQYAISDNGVLVYIKGGADEPVDSVSGRSIGNR